MSIVSPHQRISHRHSPAAAAAATAATAAARPPATAWEQLLSSGTHTRALASGKYPFLKDLSSFGTIGGLGSGAAVGTARAGPRNSLPAIPAQGLAEDAIAASLNSRRVPAGTRRCVHTSLEASFQAAGGGSAVSCSGLELSTAYTVIVGHVSGLYQIGVPYCSIVMTGCL